MRNMHDTSAIARSAIQNPCEADPASTASARAMSIYDIVYLIAIYLLHEDVLSTRETEVIAYRSVSRLWRTVSDTFLIRNVEYYEGLYRLQPCPLNVEAIIAYDTSKAKSVKTLEFETLFKAPKAKDFRLLSMCTTLHLLKLDAASLLSISRLHKISVSWPLMKQLDITLPRLEHLKQKRQRKAIAMLLNAFDRLDHLCISLGDLPCTYTTVTLEEWKAMFVGATSAVKSLALRVYASTSNGTQTLSAMFSVYNRIEHLSLHLVVQEVDFENLLPKSTIYLDLDCASAIVPDILAMLSDVDEIPNLAKVPSIHTCLLRRPGAGRVTPDLVEKAIAGLKERGVRDLVSASHKLFRLITHG